MNTLSLIDYLVIALYLGGILTLGFSFTKRQKSCKDYFIADKRIPGWAMGIALLATLVSNMTFLANPGVAFNGDWRQFFNSFMALIVIFPIALIVIPLYRNIVGMSLYEFFETRFGSPVRVYGAVAFIFYYLARMSVIFYVLALAINTMTGWPLYYLILIIGMVTILFTFLGGMEAVMWTDVVQGILLISGGIICLGIALFSAPGGPLNVIKVAAEAQKFQLGEMSWSLRSDTLLVMALYGLYQHFHNFGTDQTQVQRYLTAKSTKQATRGALISGIACVPVWALFFFVGTSIWGYYHLTGTQLPPEIMAKPDRIFPYFIMNQLPVGVVGLVLAALISSAISTLSSGLNSGATVFTNDILMKIKPQLSDRSGLKSARIVVILTGFISMSIAAWLSTLGGDALVIYFTAFSIFGGGILGLFFLAFLSKKANYKGALVGIVATLLVITWASLTKNNIIDLGRWNYDLHPYLIGLIGHLTVFIVGWISSFFLHDPKNEKKYIHPLSA